MDNTVIETENSPDIYENPYNDIEQYKSNIVSAMDIYLSELDNPEQIYNVDTFNGLIDYIYSTVFRPDKRTRQFAINSRVHNQTSIIDYRDTDTMMDLWIIYKRICSRYQKTPNITQYCSMIGVSITTLSAWLKNSGSLADRAHKEFYQTLKQDTEAALVQKTTANNSIGAIFLLKSKYGYQENNVITVQSMNLENIESASDIAERHKLETKPETPTIDE